MKKIPKNCYFLHNRLPANVRRLLMQYDKSPSYGCFRINASGAWQDDRSSHDLRSYGNSSLTSHSTSLHCRSSVIVSLGYQFQPDSVPRPSNSWDRLLQQIGTEIYRSCWLQSEEKTGHCLRLFLMHFQQHTFHQLKLTHLQLAARQHTWSLSCRYCCKRCYAQKMLYIH